MLDSRKKKSLAVWGEMRAPNVEQAGQVGNLVYLLSNKVEVIESKVAWGTVDEEKALRAWNPTYVARHAHDEAFITAIC